MRVVTRRDRIRNTTISRRTGLKIEMACRVDENILRWLSYRERKDVTCLTNRVMNATVSARALRRMPRFGWINDVKKALNI